MNPIILLIEDDDQVRSLLADLLRSVGYMVFDLSNGREAARICERHQPDLIVTDIIMPEKDGIEVIIDLRRTYPTLRALAISGGGVHNREIYLRLAEKLGATSTLVKPFTPEAFLRAVREILERR